MNTQFVTAAQLDVVKNHYLNELIKVLRYSSFSGREFLVPYRFGRGEGAGMGGGGGN